MKKRQTQTTMGCESIYYDFDAIWDKHTDSLEEIINRHVPDCRERFEHCHNRLGEEDQLIGLRSSLGNLLGTLECYSNGQKIKHLFLFMRPDQWGTGLKDRLLAEGKKVWNLDLKRDMICVFGC